jgi:hypothetical protein
MGNIVGDKSRDTPTVAINPSNHNNFLGIGAQFSVGEALYVGAQDQNKYDPSLSLRRGLH